MLRDGGTYVEMGQFTDAGSIQTSWHRVSVFQGSGTAVPGATVS